MSKFFPFSDITRAQKNSPILAYQTFLVKPYFQKRHYDSSKFFSYLKTLRTNLYFSQTFISKSQNVRFVYLLLGITILFIDPVPPAMTAYPVRHLRSGTGITLITNPYIITNHFFWFLYIFQTFSFIYYIFLDKLEHFVYGFYRVFRL